MTEKQLWVLAGANGAGKSTFYDNFLAPKGLKFVNADSIAKKLAPEAPEAFSYEAAARAELLRRQLLDDGISFCFETVFSHPSKIDFLAEAKTRGYEVVLVYIHLELPELNAARVAQRVQQGGHSVPEKKIFSRIPRTMQHIRSALPLADEVYLLDNSSAVEPYKVVLHSKAGRISQLPAKVPDWTQRLIGKG
ncbi:MAG: AAA family ATPase [Pseudomonadota bacterium]